MQVDENDVPRRRVRIAACGELPKGSTTAVDSSAADTAAAAMAVLDVSDGGIAGVAPAGAAPPAPPPSPPASLPTGG